MLLSCAFASGEATPEPVLVRAISDSASISAGTTFRLGVLFELEEPWHIYWRNPGDAGLPTSVKFELPSEFRSGELWWPTPVTFKQAGGIQGFGYEGEALFWQEVTLSEDSTLQGEVEIPVTIRWLRCSDSLCVPGRSKQKLSLSIAPHKPAETASVFEEWSNRYPVSDEAFGKYGSVSVRPGALGGDKWKVSLNWQVEMESVRWYLYADPAFRMDASPGMGVSHRVQGNTSTFEVALSRRDGVPVKDRTFLAVVVCKTKTGEEKALGLTLTDNL